MNKATTPRCAGEVSPLNPSPRVIALLSGSALAERGKLEGAVAFQGQEVASLL